MTLLERGHQLDRLRQLVEGLETGAVAVPDRVVVLGGPVGSGKTQLLQAFSNAMTGLAACYVGASAARAERHVPFELIRQLLRGLSTAGHDCADIAHALDEGHLGPVTHTGDEAVTATAQALGDALLGVAAATRLVIGVDDVHHADLPSLACLSYVARRLSSVPMLLVLTEAVRIAAHPPTVSSGLLHPANVARIRVPMLSVAGVQAMLAQRLDGTDAHRLADEAHRMTGGNPLLVKALLDDIALAGDGRPVAGESFREAVLGCLYRCEQTVLNTVRGLAVVDGPPPAGVLASLFDTQTESIRPAVTELTAAGLVQDGQLRHPAVVRAVLDGMLPEERAALHGRAARALHADGAPVPVVARHLLEAESVTEPWMTQALVEAAEQILADGEPDTALRYLRHANRHSVDDRQRAQIHSALARAQWPLDPYAATLHLPWVAGAVRDGHLDGRQAVAPVRYLLWHGRVDEAAELLRHANRGGCAADVHAAADLYAARRYLAALYPGHATATGDDGLPRPGRDPVALGEIRARLRGIDALAAVLHRGADDVAIGEAEQALLTGGLGDEPATWSATWALLALVYADRLDEADRWCVRLAEPAGRRPTPLVAALVGTLRAATALRRGDLGSALAESGAALAELSTKGWGVAVGLPRSIRLHALTQMGRLDEAAECVQSRVPAALFDSVFGLLYLHARGAYSLASGAAEAALSDFLLCGDLMTRWRLDRPALVPWRTGAAQACLRLGQARRAAGLAREQLDRLRPGHVRTRGATLRTLAATADGPRRIHLLQEAVRLLEQCGDHVELARTLTDLGWVFRTIGEHRQARSAVRAARVVMEQCQIPVSPPEPRPVPLDARRAPAPSDPAIDSLSPAEVRVAALAAHGHTNREIAKRLFVTVSTIEQQLTRIYRKLGLSGRAELAARFLAPYPVDSTPVPPPRADQPVAARTR